ncbi:MAG: SIS domain-containing protein [Candidatus Adiutrix sp.]|jgi:D-sedoheptulose 7-phosphate isomerase|nr:SIS domain-containing protein [Candidatus Adiutrix sp.]
MKPSLELVRQAQAEGLKALERAPVELLVQAARFLARALTEGRVIFLCGNGGSASQALHLAGELVGRFLLERPGLPAVALNADPAIMTAVGNDYGFDRIFARQIQALMKPGDILWALTTSGRSPNILAALAAAREAGGRTLLMCGPAVPEDLEVDLALPVQAAATPRIQEMHLFYGHTLCHLVERWLFDAPGELD